MVHRLGDGSLAALLYPLTLQFSAKARPRGRCIELLVRHLDRTLPESINVPTPHSGWQGVGVQAIDVDAFEALVAQALASIPDELRAEMENVAIIIDDQSPPGRLYGLYEGVPLTKRGTYAGANPDRITLFLATICQSATTLEELAHRVRVTLLHEVGHHFGIGEARLHELGWS
jgi:predicted Zn-dependent protease with MMP-like domain